MHMQMAIVDNVAHQHPASHMQAVVRETTLSDLRLIETHECAHATFWHVSCRAQTPTLRRCGLGHCHALLALLTIQPTPPGHEQMHTCMASWTDVGSYSATWKVNKAMQHCMCCNARTGNATSCNNPHDSVMLHADTTQHALLLWRLHLSCTYTWSCVGK
jgi:hypothetical protein